MFCPECGSMMYPDGDEMVCKDCGYSEAKGEDEEEGMKTVDEREEGEMAFVEKDVNTLPTAEVECEECGHDRAGWWMRQLRAADESETRFYRCLNCGHTWREYD